MSEPVWIINPRIVEMYEAGHSSTKIAAEFGSHSSVIIRALRSAGIKVRTQGGRGLRIGTPKKLEIIRRLRAEGKTWDHVGMKIGTSMHAAYALAKCHGLDMRRGTP